MKRTRWSLEEFDALLHRLVMEGVIKWKEAGQAKRRAKAGKHPRVDPKNS